MVQCFRAGPDWTVPGSDSSTNLFHVSHGAVENKALITRFFQGLSVVPQASQIEHDRVLLSWDVRPENPRFPLRKQRLVRDHTACRYPLVLRLLCWFDGGNVVFDHVLHGVRYPFDLSLNARR